MELYRWIKASEKMIELYTMHPARQGNILGTLERGDERFIQFRWNGGVNSYTIKSENLGSIEWLEEIEYTNQDSSLQNSELIKENEALQDKIVKQEEEIVRLKGLIEQQFFKEYPFPEQAKEDNFNEWQQFKTENNL